MSRYLRKRIGQAVEKLGRKIQQVGHAFQKPYSRFDPFLDPVALRINSARLEHLSSLEIDMFGKSILEVGAGIGLLTGFLEERGCTVLSTDGRQENVDEMLRLFPRRRAAQLDLNTLNGIDEIGMFDITFCYGTLYHLRRPREALAALARVSSTILLSTCVTPGSHIDVHLVRESAASNQAIGEIGCRPTRPWIMKTLAECWGHAYVTRFQPCHEDFETNWTAPYKHGNPRAVFVGSKLPLSNPLLSEELPDVQERVSESACSGALETDKLANLKHR